MMQDNYDDRALKVSRVDTWRTSLPNKVPSVPRNRRQRAASKRRRVSAGREREHHAPALRGMLMLVACNAGRWNR